MNKNNFKIHLIDNIMNCLKYQLIETIEEHNERLPIFNNVLNIINGMNKDSYSYTLKDIDDKLFDNLIIEIIQILT